MNQKDKINRAYSRPNGSQYLDLSRLVSLSLLIIVFFLYAIPSILFYFGSPIKSYVFPVSVILGLTATVSLNNPGNKSRTLIRILSSLIIIMFSLLISGYIYDISYDGMRYHQETVATLCNGWNPIDATTQGVAPKSIWSLHYAKAVEIIAASITAFTGCIEMGKAVGLLLWIGAGCGVYSILREDGIRLFLNSKERNVSYSWSRKKSFWFALCIMANPVVGSQIFSYYIDFYKYLYLVYLLLGLYYFTSSLKSVKKGGMIVISISLILTMGTKFNFFFEAGIWMILVFIYVGFKKEYTALRKLFVLSIASLIIGFILNYHPYLTNFLEHGHPLYPLMGEGAYDIMTGHTPPEFLDSNRLVNFFSSLFSVARPGIDQRQGGFTIFMPFILILSILIGWLTRKKVRGWVWYAAVSVFLSCFMFEQSWWARYICQLWLVAALALIISQDGKKSTTYVGYFLSIMMVMGGGWAVSRAAFRGVMDGYYIHSLLDVAKDEKVKISGYTEAQVLRHLEEHGIGYETTDTLSPDEKGRSFYYFSPLHPLIILSESGKKEMERKMRKVGKSIEQDLYSEESEEKARNYEEGFQ